MISVLLFTVIALDAGAQSPGGGGSVGACVDLDLIDAAMRVLYRNWASWTKESLAASWPGSVQPYGCEFSSPEDCASFANVRGMGEKIPLCGEHFHWKQRGTQQELASVQVYYSTPSDSEARRTAARFENAISPPSNADRMPEVQSGDGVLGGLRWEKREGARLLEMHAIEWAIQPQNGVWTLSFGYGRDVLEHE